MLSYYKCVRLDGTDFYSGMVQWAPPPGHVGEWIVRHPTATKIGAKASEHLSVSTAATDCTGMEWPCRLLTVEAVGDIATPSPITLPSKRAGLAFRVTGELPAHAVFGPQGVHVAALVEREHHLPPNEARALAAAWNDAKGSARSVAREAAWASARGAAIAAAETSVWRRPSEDAARALVVRDLITTDHYDTLTRPWREVIGPIHPDDPDLPPHVHRHQWRVEDYVCECGDVMARGLWQ